MSEFIKITGLWAGKDKNGNAYMKGNLNDKSIEALNTALEEGALKVMIFKNTYKKTENQPDYILNLTKDEPRQEKKVDSDELNRLLDEG